MATQNRPKPKLLQSIAYQQIYHPCACGCGELIQKHKFQRGYLIAKIRYFKDGHYRRNAKGTKPIFGDEEPWQPIVLDYTEPEQCGNCGAGRANILCEREIWQDASWLTPCAHWRCMLCGWRKMIKRAVNEQEIAEIPANETAPTK